MARNSVLGKRGRADANADNLTLAPRKRRGLRSAVFDDEDRENAPPAAEDEVARGPAPAPAKRAVGRPAKHLGVVTQVFGQFAAKKAPTLVAPSPQLLPPTNPQLLTPTTPRHHDVLAKETPRHRVQVAARLPLTPRTPRTPTGPPTVYQVARQLFARSAAPHQLVGREAECAAVRAFVEDGIAARAGRCLYISGPPGTGKSAFVGRLCSALGDRTGVTTASVNCMSVRSSAELCGKLAQELQGNATPATLDGLRELFFPKKKAAPVCVVTLDEIDHLLTFDLEILYTLFEWACNPTSRLVLVGIANALDLTDRFLPRLKSRNLSPTLLQFPPYTVPEIVAVVTARLQSLDPGAHPVPFVQSPAITFCAKKVATQTGDLRKAFDLIRRVLDVVEAETRATALAAAAAADSASSPLAENPNLATPSRPLAPRLSDPLAHLTPATAPRATVAHAARVAAAAFHHGTPQRLRALNVQQKAALCALLALEKRTVTAAQRGPFNTPTKAAVPTVRALHGLYASLCMRAGTLAPLGRGEFGEVVASLEGLGLVREVKAKAGKKMVGGGVKEDRGVASAVSEKELEGVLEGVVGGLLRGVLAGEVV